MSRFYRSGTLPLPARRLQMDSTPLLSSGPERETAARIRLPSDQSANLLSASGAFSQN